MSLDIKQSVAHGRVIEPLELVRSGLTTNCRHYPLI